MTALWVLGGLSAVLALLSASSLLRSKVWWIRGLDFPRLQVAALGLLIVALALALLDLRLPASWAVLGLAGACTLYQAWWILPFTRLIAQEVQATGEAGPDRRLRMLVTNVLMTNRNAASLLQMVRTHRPHILLTLETDGWWQQQLDTLADDYPHALKCPLDNLYGMHLYSRLPLEDTQVQYLVEPDVPSMHALVVLPCGEHVRLHCLHPAPPSPSENETSSQRDAELVIVGRSVAETDQPVIVAGDLNDVAWSRTTRLFRKLSGLLDPRVGRRMVNTFHAEHALLRWPLDHLFHSEHFTLARMQRLQAYGSDHFPILVEIALEPQRAPQQSGLEPDQDDRESAGEAADSQGVSKENVHAPGKDGDRVNR
ncbi:MAG: endonuclease/exonuclease/phosphatase family protein [Rubrivivax sp.]